MDNVPAIGYAQTAAEIAAGVTPTNYAYPELYFERYGGSVSAAVGSNNTPMIHALAVATARGGGILYFPSAGSYLFNNTTAYTLPLGLNIQGTGTETILNWNGASGETFLTIPSGSQGGLNELRDIQLVGPGGGTASSTTSNLGTGLQIGDSNGSPNYFVAMRRVSIVGFNTAMVLAGVENGGRFEMCEFGTDSGDYSNNVGIDFYFAASTNQVNSLTFSDCIIQGNANAGVQATSTPVRMFGIRWTGCTIQDNCVTATSPQFYMGLVRSFEILGLYMEGSSTVEAIRADTMSQGLIADFYIDGCSYGIHDHGGGSMNQVDIMDGSIAGAATAAIYMASEFDVVVRNLNTSGGVTVTGSGCSYLPLGSGLASWPATNDTFTPTLSATSGTPTYTTQIGGYSKTGNIVNFNLSIVTSALGSLTGPIQINGLPVALENDHTISAILTIQCIGITPSGSNNQFYGKLAAGATAITIWGGGTSAPAQVQASALAAATTINITGSYQTLS